MPTYLYCFNCGARLSLPAPQVARPVPSVGAPARYAPVAQSSQKGRSQPKITRLVVFLGVFLLLAIIGILCVVRISANREREAAREAAYRERIRLTFSRLCTIVPNLQYFPGWEQTNNEAVTLTSCTVQSVQFAGDAGHPRVKLHIINRTVSATQPAVDVTLYDEDGNRLVSCRPVEFIFKDFQPNEEKDMPESFSSILTEPLFYSVTEPAAPQTSAAPAPAAESQSNDMSRQVLSELKKYTYDGFGGAGYDVKYAASWYSLIDSYEVSFSNGKYYVAVRTSIWDDSDASKPVDGIFASVRSFMYSDVGRKYSIGCITIYGKSSSGDRILRSE